MAQNPQAKKAAYMHQAVTGTLAPREETRHFHHILYPQSTCTMACLAVNLYVCNLNTYSTPAYLVLIFDRGTTLAAAGGNIGTTSSEYGTVLKNGANEKLPCVFYHQYDSL